jgi:hypothetical protein
MEKLIFFLTAFLTTFIILGIIVIWLNISERSFENRIRKNTDEKLYSNFPDDFKKYGHGNN